MNEFLEEFKKKMNEFLEETKQILRILKRQELKAYFEETKQEMNEFLMRPYRK